LREYSFASEVLSFVLSKIVSALRLELVQLDLAVHQLLILLTERPLCFQLRHLAQQELPFLGELRRDRLVLGQLGQLLEPFLRLGQRGGVAGKRKVDTTAAEDKVLLLFLLFGFCRPAGPSSAAFCPRYSVNSSTVTRPSGS